MGTAISIYIELDAVQSFLERVYACVDSEYRELIARADSGEFIEENEEANAFFRPRASEKIAMKAALNEINSIVEWELFSIALEPFMDAQANKKPYGLRLVWDLDRRELTELIENYYCITLDSLPGYLEVEEVRKAINAFKHRKGFKDPRRNRDTNGNSIFGQFELDRATIANYLDGARRFLRALLSQDKA